MDGIIAVTRLNGTQLEIPVESVSTMNELRKRVAADLQILPSRVKLMCGDRVLTHSDATAELSGVTVVAYSVCAPDVYSEARPAAAPGGGG